MTIIATLHRDGRTIVKSTVTQVIPGGAQGLYLTFTFSELRTVEQLLHLEITTWVQSHNPQDKTYSKNTVGLSLYLDAAAGTTLTAEAVAIGN